jgi:predicted SAM-dependent methyltransferase
MKLMAPFKDHIKSFFFKRMAFSDSYLKSGSDFRIRLHLGSGSAIIPDFINVDMLSIPGVALRCDLSKTLPFKDECANECYLCHVLEHFATNQVPQILKELSRIMKPGAILRVCVPDLDIIFRTYVNNIEWFSPPHNLC